MNSAVLHHSSQSQGLDGSQQWRIQNSPEVGAPTLRGCQHTIVPSFPKNFLKLKEFGRVRGAFKILLCRSATAQLRLELKKSLNSAIHRAASSLVTGRSQKTANRNAPLPRPFLQAAPIDSQSTQELYQSKSWNCREP